MALVHESGNRNSSAIKVPVVSQQSQRPLATEELADVPSWVFAVVKSGMARSEVLAATAIAGAIRGEKPYFGEVLKRVWPVDVSVSATIDPAPPWFVKLEDTSHLSEEDKATVLRIAHKALSRPREK
jgi:hypothetical protein